VRSSARILRQPVMWHTLYVNEQVSESDRGSLWSSVKESLASGVEDNTAQPEGRINTGAHGCG